MTEESLLKKIIQDAPMLELNHKSYRPIEAIILTLFRLCSFVAIAITIAIAGILIINTYYFSQLSSLTGLLFGTKWHPSSEQFGLWPLLIGTIKIAVIALLTAVPIGIMSAVYISCYLSPKARGRIKPLIELLAGIPTVVYGFIALMLMSPMLTSFGQITGIQVSSDSALGVGFIMGIMITPYITTLSDDVLTAAPQTLKDGSLALGATHSETIKGVMLPAAAAGIAASILLALSRAIGETMIVVMAAGYSATMSLNPLDSATTVTVQIVNLLTGDNEFTSPPALAAFALGLALLLITLLMNILAMKIVQRHKDKFS